MRFVLCILGPVVFTLIHFERNVDSLGDQVYRSGKELEFQCQHCQKKLTNVEHFPTTFLQSSQRTQTIEYILVYSTKKVSLQQHKMWTPCPVSHKVLFMAIFTVIGVMQSAAQTIRMEWNICPWDNCVIGKYANITDVVINPDPAPLGKNVRGLIVFTHSLHSYLFAD